MFSTPFLLGESKVKHGVTDKILLLRVSWNVKKNIRISVLEYVGLL